jgi:hypothetical protein
MDVFEHAFMIDYVLKRRIASKLSSKTSTGWLLKRDSTRCLNLAYGPGDSLPMIQKERLRPLNNETAKTLGYVLYWMQSPQRAFYNHAAEI